MLLVRSDRQTRNTENRTGAILDDHSVFGRSRVALKTFKTKREAENFYKYAKSELIRVFEDMKQKMIDIWNSR